MAFCENSVKAYGRFAYGREHLISLERLPTKVIFSIDESLYTVINNCGTGERPICFNILLTAENGHMLYTNVTLLKAMKK